MAFSFSHCTCDIYRFSPGCTKPTLNLVKPEQCSRQISAGRNQNICRKSGIRSREQVLLTSVVGQVSIHVSEPISSGTRRVFLRNFQLIRSLPLAPNQGSIMGLVGHPCPSADCCPELANERGGHEGFFVTYGAHGSLAQGRFCMKPLCTQRRR